MLGILKNHYHTRYKTQNIKLNVFMVIKPNSPKLKLEQSQKYSVINTH